MAEAFLRHFAADRFEAYSAGFDLEPIDRHVAPVMQEVGIDIGGQYPKHLQQYMGRLHFGYLITVCSEAERRCPTTFPGMGQRLFWDLEDPSAFEGPEEARLDKFREVRDRIAASIKDWLAAQGIDTRGS